jgi:hypothetical protein
MTLTQLAALAVLAWVLFWFGPPIYRAVQARVADWIEDSQSQRSRR